LRHNSIQKITIASSSTTKLPTNTIIIIMAMEITEPSDIPPDQHPGIELPAGLMSEPLEEVQSGNKTEINPESNNNNELLLAEEQRMENIEKPHHHDVLCGRGVTTNRFPGNESFRAIVSLNKVSSRHCCR
jgi:hypothetical protein